MSLGLLEFIFAFFMFCLIWWAVFKFALKSGTLKLRRDLLKKIERGDQTFVIDGHEILMQMPGSKEKEAEEEQKDQEAVDEFFEEAPEQIPELEKEPEENKVPEEDLSTEEEIVEPKPKKKKPKKKVDSDVDKIKK